MKIVNISHTDKGGAGTAVLRTHKRLLELGYNSILYLASDRKPTNTLINRIDRRFGHRFKKLKAVFFKQRSPVVFSDKVAKYCFFSTSELEKISICSILDNIDDGDVILMYWLGSKMLNTSNFIQLSKKRKIKLVWYAVDMAPITGGCHYFWECKGYQNSCLNCPVFDGEEKSLAYYQFLSKMKNLRKVSINLVSPSHVGRRIFESGSLKFNSYSVLPFAIDTKIFDIQTQPTGKVTNGFSIFFNAQNIYDIRKGWSYLKEAIFLLDQLLVMSGTSYNVSILSVAYDAHVPHFQELKRIKLINKGGYAIDERDLAALYQSADAFICTSTEDLNPLMVNEALLCGIPVIGFNNASNDEYIEENRTGNLIKPFDVNQMAQIIFQVISGEIIYLSGKEIRNSVIALHESTSWNKKFTEEILNN